MAAKKSPQKTRSKKAARPMTDAELDRVSAGVDPKLTAYGAQDFYLTGAAGKFVVSPWNNSTIEPDFNPRRALDTPDPMTGNQIAETTVSNTAPLIKRRR